MNLQEKITYGAIWVIILSLFAFIVLSFGCIQNVTAISFNTSEISPNGMILNVTHEGEYSVYVNEELKYNSSSNQIVFSDFNPDTSYQIRISDSTSSYSEIIKTGESKYGGINLSVIVLFSIWLIVMVLGILYMPFLIIIDVIPIVIILTDTASGIENPLLKFLFAMLLPVTILVFGWRVSE